MRLNEHCYVPRLLVKKGEMTALSEMNPVTLGAESDETMYPLLEIPDIEWNYEDECPDKEPDDFIAEKCKLIEGSWSQPAFLDAAAVVTNQNGNDEPVALIGKAFSELDGKTEMIPVLHDLETTSKAYEQVQSLIKHMSCSEVCLRFQDQKWLELINRAGFDSWLDGLGISEKRCHVIIDLQSHVDESSYNAVAIVLSNMILGLYKELDFVILGTAVPERLDPGVNEVPRCEWNNWRSVIAELGGGPIAFGDYGTVGLTMPTDIDPRMMSISGKFKYTLTDSWLLGKKGLFKGPKGIGGEAIKPILSAIAEDPRFLNNHCWADDWIKRVASGTLTKYGNPTTWVKEATLHHMSLVLEQVAAI